MRRKMLKLEGKKLNNDFDKFVYYHEMAWVSLECIVDDWKPKKKEYASFVDFRDEFLYFFKANSSVSIPEVYEKSLLKILSNKYDWYAKGK